MMSISWIEIDLEQLRQNISIIKKQIGPVRFCFPIKANGYGHGISEIAKASKEEVDFFAITSLCEGKILREENSGPVE